MKKQIVLLLIFLNFISFANAQWAYDSITFETLTSKIVIDTTGGNLWQIGMPQKTFFSAAHAGTNAILTDTINTYPPNDTSSFIYIIPNTFTQTCKTCMDFWHKYDMDTMGDMGIIDASYDGGNSWLLLNDTSAYEVSYVFNWVGDYNANSGNYTAHKLITSGRSDGWIKSSFCWDWWMPVKSDTIISNPDSLMIRFTFISDSVIKNKEGWMIDDFVISKPPSGWCSGIEENSNIEHFSVYPNPANDNLTIETTDISKQQTIFIYNMQGQLLLQQAMQEPKTEIDICSLAKGVYVIKLSKKDGIAVRKFIKE